MKIIRIKNKVLISLAIGFLSINLGIGIANEAMEKTRSYYLGDPINQTIVSLNTSFGGENISSDLISSSLKEVQNMCPIIVGPYILTDDVTNENQLLSEVYFVNNKYDNKIKLMQGEFLTKEDINNGCQVVLGSDMYKLYEKNITDEILKFRDEEYQIKGQAISKFEKQRINNSMFLSIEDISKVIKEPYISREPFYLELIFEGRNSQEIANKFIDEFNSIKGDLVVNINTHRYSEDYKEDINPSSYIIMGFSILIMILTVMNIWLLTNVLIEQNYNKFAILKALGSSEEMIALDFIKQLLYKIMIAGVLGYASFFCVKVILEKMLDIGIYNNINNFITTILLCIITCLISSIRPYYKIKKLNLINYIKI